MADYINRDCFSQVGKQTALSSVQLSLVFVSSSWEGCAGPAKNTLAWGLILMCDLCWVGGGSDIWLNMISVYVFEHFKGRVNSVINRLNKADCLPNVGEPHLPVKAGKAWKAELSVTMLVFSCLTESYLTGTIVSPAWGPQIMGCLSPCELHSQENQVEENSGTVQHHARVKMKGPWMSGYFQRIGSWESLDNPD